MKLSDAIHELEDFMLKHGDIDVRMSLAVLPAHGCIDILIPGGNPPPPPDGDVGGIERKGI